MGLNFNYNQTLNGVFSMFKHSKKSIALVLLLALGANSCSYGINFGFLWSSSDQPGILQKAKNGIVRAKNYIGQKLAWVKNKIVEHATVGNVSLAISTGLIATFYALQYRKKYFCLNKIHKAAAVPKKVKNSVIGIAKKLGIKSPEKLRVASHKAFGKMNGSGPFRSLALSEKTVQNIHSNKSKFIIGHELSHYKHNDSYVKPFLNLSLFLLFAILRRNKFKNGTEDVHLFRGGDHLSFGKRLLVRSLLLGGHVFRDIATFLCLQFAPIIQNNTFSRYCEVRSDLEAASLGKKIVDGGIGLFKERALEEKKDKSSLVEKFLFYFIEDPHLPASFRLKYLQWYKKWKYG